MALFEFISVLKKNQSEFAAVIPLDISKDKLLLLDFTLANPEITEDILNDTKEFTGYIDQKLKKGNARYGIGGYNEHRTLYSRSKIFDAAIQDEEPRRLHLGTDIWGRPHTSVMAPLNGIVHSFAFNNNFGDYGATIILSHSFYEMNFYTLYGHLSINSIKNLNAGDRFEKGDVLAEFGIPSENGHWPPHLHFQVIIDLKEWKGDYPGVCKYSEKEKWLANCPDPDMILQLNQYL